MRKLVYPVLLLFAVLSVPVQAAPTFADLAVLLARGYFKDNVPPDASVEECVVFLNQHGICFSMFDLMDPNARVTKEDFARVIGQSRLLFLGEAELERGCIKKPIKVKNWVDYCLLNDVPLQPVWDRFRKKTEKESLPEVRRFFGKAP